MSELFKGKPVIDTITEQNVKRIEELKKNGIEPCLAIVRLGENPEDISYERGAIKRAEATGVKVKQFIFDIDITQDEILEEIDKINKDDSIHGVLLFRPLPKHLDDRTVCEALAPSKDMDGITQGSMAGVYTDSGEGYPPCTARACIEMLDHIGYDLSGKKVTVMGRSLVVGKPVAMMAMKRNATVTVLHSRTTEEDFAAAGKNADVVIAAIGRAKMIGAEKLGNDQIIIDVGINVDEDGKLCGDVDCDAVEGQVKMITPVPGGVGGVTTAVLMKHVIEAAEKTMA